MGSLVFARTYPSYIIVNEIFKSFQNRGLYLERLISNPLYNLYAQLCRLLNILSLVVLPILLLLHCLVVPSILLLVALSGLTVDVEYNKIIISLTFTMPLPYIALH